MILLSWNCQGGLRCKIDEVKLIIKKYLPHIFFINESEINPQEDLGYFAIDNYKLIINEKHKTCRIACYVNNKIDFKLLNFTDKADIIGLEVDNIKFYGAYRGFTDKEGTSASSQLDEILSISSEPNTILIGDLNTDPRRDNNKWNGKKLKDWMIKEGMIQLVKGDTRRRVVSKSNGDMKLEQSKLDLILTNTDKDICISKNTGYRSDHFVIIAGMDCGKPIKMTRKSIIRDYTKLTQHNINRHIITKPKIINNLDDLTTYHREIADKLAPERVMRTRDETQYINPRIEKCKKRRDRLYRRYKKYGDPEDLIKVKEESKNLRRIIRKEMKWIVQKKATADNPKAFWKVVKDVQGKTKAPDNIVIDGQTKLENERDIACRFAYFFKEKIEKLTKNHQRLRDTTHIMDDLKSKRIIEPITETEVEEASRKLKNKTSMGIDGVPTRVVKHATKQQIKIYTKIFNEILMQGMPEEWKTARVIAIPKKKNNVNIENHRPISNLCAMEKLFEKCILLRLEKLNMDSIAGKHQHAYRKSHSTQTCLIELVNCIAEHLDEKKKVSLYTVDLSAAFDLLRVDTFLEDNYNKLPDYLLWTLGDFLQNRKFFVERNGSKSETFGLDLGCAQGSVLGPVIFNLYMKGLPEAVNSDLTVSYADDTYVVVTGDDWANCRTKPNETE